MPMARSRSSRGTTSCWSTTKRRLSPSPPEVASGLPRAFTARGGPAARHPETAKGPFERETGLTSGRAEVRAARELLEQIHLWRHGEDLTAFGLDQLPLAFMRQPVVTQAQQGEVIQVCRSASDPVHEVMS